MLAVRGGFGGVVAMIFVIAAVEFLDGVQDGAQDVTLVENANGIVDDALLGMSGARHQECGVRACLERKSIDHGNGRRRIDQYPVERSGELLRRLSKPLRVEDFDGIL